MHTTLITGGAGFVGSNIAIKIKQDKKNHRVIALDNLKRRGSELNIVRLKQAGVEFVHGDVRSREDLFSLGKIDCLIECSAEPSVLAGYDGSLDYVINTNLFGTVNCLELARKWDANFIFLSTSRVYPIKLINSLRYDITDTRFKWVNDQSVPGMTNLGVSENFPLKGARSLYGATKLASELILQEYIDMYNLQAVINRCGVITGPWQMGKVDQGVVVLWVARHIYKKKLSYIGYGGEGKQVRDILHIDDLYRLISMQIKDIGKFSDQTYNVGGGRKVSISLKELTYLCQKYTGETIPIDSLKEDRTGDIPIYITDHKKITEQTGWTPKITTDQIIVEITEWILENKELLLPILS